MTSLFPHLPRSSMQVFRGCLLVGVGIVAALAFAGLYPVAVATAACLVPVLTVVYLYDVDLYEDEPLRIVMLTVASGALAGLAAQSLERAWSPEGLQALAQTNTVLRGVLVPVLILALGMLGPLVLLPYRAFNDVLDGVTFGAAAGATLAGAFTVSAGRHLFTGGLRPGGALGPWLAFLLHDAVAWPVLAACAIGGACASLWLRYRSPVADRAALGAVGLPVVAVPAAFVLLMGWGFARSLNDPWWTLAATTGLAVAGLLWLRQAIHLGLVQEADEAEPGADVSCANCGNTTPSHTFCSTCGIALRALPKARLAATEAPDA